MTALVSEAARFAVPLSPHRPSTDGRSLTPAETESDRRHRMLKALSVSLRDLGDVTDVQRLVDTAPQALCRVGFDRAMISRIEEREWWVERFHSEVDHAAGEEVTAAARREPLLLGPSLIEVEIVRRRVPLLVPDVAREPRVSRGLRELTGSHSYVAAPVMPEGRVIGLLHADRPGGDPLDEFDRDVIGMFAQQFGVLVHKARLTERVVALRGDIDRLLGHLGGAVADCLGSGIGLQATPATTGGEAPRLSSPPAGAFVEAAGMDQLLSAREREVLRLMALGETNTRIASRLVISEGTVKSHVRHILRKLGASNRAEAVCRWLQRTPDDTV